MRSSVNYHIIELEFERLNCHFQSDHNSSFDLDSVNFKISGQMLGTLHTTCQIRPETKDQIKWKMVHFYEYKVVFTLSDIGSRM